VGGARRAEALDALVRAGNGAREAAEALAGDPRARSEARALALMALCHIGTPESVERVAQAFGARSPQVRAAAALLAGQVGARSAQRHVARVIHDRDEYVRMVAAYAAAKLGDEGRLFELGCQLRAGREPARFLAATLLSRLESPAAARTLRDGLSARHRQKGPRCSRSYPPGIRALAARGIAKRGLDDPKTIEKLRMMAFDISTQVRAVAAGALGEIGTPEAVKALEQYLFDVEPRVRARACRALERTGRTSAVPLVVRALDDRDESVVRAAMSAMQRLTKQDFGIDPARAPGYDELRDAVGRVQLWWIEHGREFVRP
jgi:hypothetical protein